MTSPVPPRAPLVLRYPQLIESTVLAVIALIAVVDAFTAAAGPASGQLGPSVLRGWVPGAYLALTVSVAGFVLAWWRPWPGLVLLTAAPLVSALLQWDPIATWNLAVFATFWLTSRSVPGLPAALLVGAGNVTAAALASGGFSLRMPTAAIAGLAAVAAAGAGSAVRGQRRYWAALEQRNRDAVATREVEVQRQVVQERIRIARDLHDVVGHEVALVSLHLGALEVHLPDGRDTQQARADVVAARTGLQAVLAGTQQLLRVLRAGPEDEGSAPAAGYDRIDDLVTQARAAGLEVEAIIAPRVPSPSPAVSTAAYRIVQEALTNAHRHGAGAVSLTVAGDTRAVTVEAVNVRGPRGQASDSGGFGLVGMRERAASVGGWIDTKSDDTLFWLWAYLPLDRDPLEAGGTT